MSDDAELLEGYGPDETIAKLTEQAHAARGRGDRDEAQRLFDRRSAVAARFDESIEDREARPDAPTGSGRPDDPGVPGEPEFDAAGPEPLDADAISEVVTNMREVGVSEEALEALHSEWGVDAGANLAYAAEFSRQLQDENPEFAAAVDREAERDPAVLYSMLRLAAKLGRQTVHGGNSAMEQITRETNPMSRTGKPSAKGEAEMQRLTAEAHKARHEGRGAEAQKLFAQRSQLARQLYGDAPIVGGDPGVNY